MTGIDGVDEKTWADAAAVFRENELADLLYLIGLMNLFNTLNVATEFPAELWRDGGLTALRGTAPNVTG